MPLDQPQPFDEQHWVDESLEQNLDVVAARLGVDIAKSNVKIAQAGHMPTLDLYARYGESASDAHVVHDGAGRNSRTRPAAARRSRPTSTATTTRSASASTCRSSRAA